VKTHKKNLSIVLLVFLIAGAVSAQSSTGFHHRMNDSSGPVNDYLGFNNPGTAVNSPVFGASGVSKSQGDWDTGKGIKFNTLDNDSIKHSNADYVQMGDSSFTFATWFKISAGSNKIVSFLSKRNTNNNFKGYHFYAHQFANEFAFQLNDGAVTDFRVPYTIKEETLYHVVYSIDKDENNASVYLNGSYLGSKDISGIGSVNSTVDLLLGGNYDRPDYYMNGTLDETYLIKGDALNSSEVNTLYSKNSYDTGPTSTNTAPSVTNVNPSDGATDITDTDDLFHTDADISATIDDTDNSNLNVWFFNASNDEILYNENLVASGTTVQTQLENLSYGQTVDWYVKVSDGVTNTTSSTYSFTTFQPLGFFQQYRSAVDFNKTLVSSNALGSKAHNVVSYTQHAITTFNNSQYTAFLDTNGNLIAGKRSASGGSWNTQDTGFDCNDLTDPHHITSVGVTNDGIVHISYCHHNEPLNYITSDSAESISSFSSSSMTGTNENSVTYPRFLRTQDSLLFTYRNGVSGDGDRYLNEYDSSTSSWSALHHPWIQGGGESVYLDRLVEDDQGNLHVTWLWRGTGGADTNHNYSYAFSSDGGSTWESSTGNQYSIPITESEVEKFDPLDKQSGVLNSNDLTTDDYGNPHVAYFKKDSYGNINYYHAWNNGSQWKFNKITNMTEFSSGGYTYFEEDLARPAIFGNGDKVGVLMRGGQDHLIRYATATPPYENWKFESFTGLWGAMEFGYDRYAFQKNQSLEFLVQRVETSDGDQNELYSIQKNLEGFQEIEIIDSTPPTSSDNWTASGFVDQDSAIVELTATDTGGSGVADIYYRVNGGSYSVEQGSSASVTISSQGNNTLEYYAEDSAGNTEATNTEYVAFETTNAPSAGLTKNVSNPKTLETIEFDASGSTDSDGSISSYEWDLNDDGIFDDATGFTATKSYSDNTSSGQTESISVRVTDNDGLTDTSTITFSVDNRQPSASFTKSTTNLKVDVDASGSSDQDGSISSYEWDWTNDGSFDASGQTQSYNYSFGGSYNLKLRVTDDDGATSTVLKTVDVSSDSTSGGGSDTGPTEVAFTLDNVGSSAWVVENDSTGVADDSENPDINLEQGKRYTIRNNGYGTYGTHPLAFFDSSGNILLSQSSTGSFESDADVNWVDNGDTVSFTVTQELYDALSGYKCTVHGSMEGDIVQESSSSPSTGGGGGGGSSDDDDTLSVTSTGNQSNSTLVSGSLDNLPTELNPGIGLVIILALLVLPAYRLIQ